MKIGFVVNELSWETTAYTTTHLAYSAYKRGHDVYYLNVGDLTYFPDGSMGGKAYVVNAKKKLKNIEAFIAFAKSADAQSETIHSTVLDALMLRYNPVEKGDDREWIRQGGLVFGQIAARDGVLVLSHPDTLSFAINKMYFQHFPAEVRPSTVITRDPDEIVNFYNNHNKHVVLKPLMGSGGQDVFMMQGDTSNLNQIVETIGSKGYIIAQEFLPEATKGDVRFFLMNGKPIVIDGKYAAVERISGKSDFRNNISAGGSIKKVKVTQKMLDLAETVRPKLVRDGLFLVGLDIAGDKLIEINVISSGALNACVELEGKDFVGEVIASIERKVRYKELYGKDLTNKHLASME